MNRQGAFFPLVLAILATGCLLSFLYPSTHEHWLPILLALGVVGGGVMSANR